MISGSIVALVSPMTSAGDLDWPALDRLVEMHVAQGTAAIVAMGTTGESATLNVQEHCAVIHRVVDVVAGRIPVIAGTGANSTTEAIELTRRAKEAKADACLLVTPYYNKPTQEGLFQHYKSVANAVAIPQFLYNVPGRTACDLRNETVERLMFVDHIVGIKDATGDMQRGKELIERCGDRLQILSGDDESFLDFIALGAKGNISVTANVAPQAMSEICCLALAGELDRAHALNSKLEPLHCHLFCESNPIPVKWAMYEMGLIATGIRLPLTPLSEQYRNKVREALQYAGIN